MQWVVCEAVGPAYPDPLLTAGGISAGGLRAVRLWEPLTALFVVGVGAGWLLPWNWLLLALTGRPLEAVIGRRHLVQVFFVSGAAGGLTQAAVQWTGHAVNAPMGEALAASAGVFFALACVHPRSALLPGFPRLRRLKIVHGAAGAAGALCIAAAVGGPMQGMALGGLAGGLAGCLSMRALGFGRRTQENDPLLDVADISVEPVPAPVAAAGGDLVVPRFTERERRMTPREYVSEKIDPILEKISRHGIGSLTAEERPRVGKGPREDRPGTVTVSLFPLFSHLSLVPKLHLGTPLLAKSYFAVMAC